MDSSKHRLCGDFLKLKARKSALCSNKRSHKILAWILKRVYRQIKDMPKTHFPNAIVLLVCIFSTKNIHAYFWLGN